MTAFEVVRNVDADECPWLSEPFHAGEIVEEFTGPTYGAVSRVGVAVTRVNPDGSERFVEIPQDALREVAAK